MTDLRKPDNRAVICEEDAPVLKLVLVPHDNSLWVATTNSHVNCWPLHSNKWGGASYFNWDEYDLESAPPLATEPTMTIRGNPAIRHYHVLNNKRHVLTKDTENNVAVYDVLEARKIEDLGNNVDFEAEIKKRFQVVARLLSIVAKLLSLANICAKLVLGRP